MNRLERKTRKPLGGTLVARMTISEIEKIVGSWPDPWPNILEVLQKRRDDALKRAETEDEHAKALGDYADSLARIRVEPRSTQL